MTADLLAFLRAALDEVERVAGAAIGNGPILRHGERGVWPDPCTHEAHRRYETPSHDLLCARIEGPDITIYDEGGHTPEQAVHIALHDPRAALARVQAERFILREFDEAGAYYTVHTAAPAGEMQGLWTAVRTLAHGHRHTIPGYNPAWAPEGVSADA